MPPLVSVVIPVFNRAEQLEKALCSVVSQSFSDWEAVVVDDGSSEQFAQTLSRICARDKVRVLRHQSNRGSSAARNTGICASRGRYISFLDSDDWWHSEKLQRQLEAIESDPIPDTVFCATRTRIVMNAGHVRIRPQRPPAPGENWSEYLYVANGFAQTNSFLVTRNLAMRVLFEQKLLRHEDSLFFLKAGALGARYRLVEEPLSIWNDDTRADRVSLSPKYLEQSRQFLTEAGMLITEKARMAFEVRVLGPLLLRENLAEAIKLFVRAVKNGVVRPRDLLAVSVRYALPERSVDALRRVLNA